MYLLDATTVRHRYTFQLKWTSGVQHTRPVGHSPVRRPLLTDPPINKSVPDTTKNTIECDYHATDIIVSQVINCDFIINLRIHITHMYYPCLAISLGTICETIMSFSLCCNLLKLFINRTGQLYCITLQNIKCELNA